jgi:membrane associated rhomboid family serine protease
MLPLKDDNKSRTFPVVTLTIILANVLVFIYQASAGRGAFEIFVYTYGLIPYNLFTNTEKIVPIAVQPSMPEFFKIFTSMFMHGGFFHLLFNMWILWIFGDNVEDSMGKSRYFLFYLICGAVACLAHALFNPDSKVPLVGASGAIAGVMGAYMLLYPRAKVLTLIIIFIFIRIVRIPAAFFLGFWFLIQLLYSPLPNSPVAYLAHVGGLVAGLALVFLFARRRKKGFRVISVK